jgi:hypothetical protein
MAIPNNASSISYIHAIDTTQFGHNRGKTGNSRNMTFKANSQHLVDGKHVEGLFYNYSLSQELSMNFLNHMN